MNQYVINTNIMYVINKYPGIRYGSDNQNKYYITEYTGKEYTSKDDIPKFVRIETNTGVSTAYLKIEDVPQQEQQYFKDLQTR